jgi:ABC-type glycerol-3-phosphate transport system substrate-binding protein
MKRRTRIVSLLVAALMLATALAAAVPAFAEETITLRMVESLTSPTRTQLLRTQLDAFEAANPGIKVELISPPLSDADNKIAQMLMNSQPLDVLEVRDHTAAQFVNNKWIAAMDDYIADWAEYDSLKPIAKTDTSAIGGAAYLIPDGFYQRCVYYNTKYFEEAGLTPPRTMGELYETAKALTDPSVNATATRSAAPRADTGTPRCTSRRTWAPRWIPPAPSTPPTARPSSPSPRRWRR